MDKIVQILITASRTHLESMIEPEREDLSKLPIEHIVTENLLISSNRSANNRDKKKICIGDDLRSSQAPCLWMSRWARR